MIFKSKHYHPVSQYMSTEISFAEPETPILEIIETMKQNGIRHIPVLDIKGHPIGIISERDTKIFTNPEWASKFAAENAMTKNPICVKSTASLSSVAQIMIGHKIDSVIVVDNEGGIEGIFTSVDALRAMHEMLETELGENQDPSEAIYQPKAS